MGEDKLVERLAQAIGPYIESQVEANDLLTEILTALDLPGLLKAEREALCQAVPELPPAFSGGRPTGYDKGWNAAVAVYRQGIRDEADG